jgi:hypothetical protein
MPDMSTMGRRLTIRIGSPSLQDKLPEAIYMSFKDCQGIVSAGTFRANLLMLDARCDIDLNIDVKDANIGGRELTLKGQVGQLFIGDVTKNLKAATLQVKELYGNSLNGAKLSVNPQQILNLWEIIDCDLSALGHPLYEKVTYKNK